MICCGWMLPTLFASLMVPILAVLERPEMPDKLGIPEIVEIVLPP